jgi:CelD/BcsL family acetyltransferase involved in cellulose biosynthesis
VVVVAWSGATAALVDRRRLRLAEWWACSACEIDLPLLMPGGGAVLHELVHWLGEGGATVAELREVCCMCLSVNVEPGWNVRVEN